MNVVRPLSFALLIVALAVGGCATARAKARPDLPSLEVPDPPARVIVPPAAEAPTTQDDTRVAVPAPAVPGGKPGQRSSPSNRAEAPRTDKRPDPPSAPEPVKPQVAVAPGPTLEQALPTKPDEIEKQVRDRLKQAKLDLSKVDYQALSPDGKAQYDTAKRFMEQADQALGQKNFVFAAKVGDKAAGLAAGLVGR